MQNTLIDQAAVIDYPEQHEKVTAPTYTFRICAAPGAVKVEVRIDEGDWQSCRPAVGYWWFDWAGYKSGRHELACRAHNGDGRIAMGEPRSFLAELEVAPKAPVKKTLFRSAQERAR